MDLYDVMRTAGQTKIFSSDPVPLETVVRILDHARFAPSGGNHQGWRVVVVGSPAVRRALRDIYQPVWDEHRRDLAEQRARAAAGETEHSVPTRTELAADEFVRHLDEIAYLVVVGVDLDALTITDSELDRPSVVGGASIYPFVHNIVLAAHNEGIGVALTTLICREEPKVKELLGLPDSIAVAALVALGSIGPGGSVTRLSRHPVSAFAHLDHFGTALDEGAVS
jgi:nitroreductase